MTLSRLCKPLVCLLAARRCVAAVEFALLAPLFVLMFAGIVDLGNALWTWCRLEEAVAAGTGFALVNGGVNSNYVNATNGQNLASDIAGIVANSAKVGSYLTPADVTVVVNNGPATTITNGVSSNSGTVGNADLFWCPTGPTGSPPTWSWGASSGTAGTACTGGGKSGKFVTVTASYNFTPFFASYAFVRNGAITAGAVVQTK
jgi:Flp pilus assembly protein TadG